MAKERVALIDGTGLIYRAFFALPNSLKTTAGLQTNAIYGFATMFRKLLAGKTPKYGAVVFDAPGGTFRRQEYAAYKANRPMMPGALQSQLEWIDKLVEAHNYPILRIRGVEADDVIGTLARVVIEAGHEVMIVSGDKDFAQLVTAGVRMFDSTKDVVFNADLVFKKWGVRPDQFADYLGIVGDKSDNIPGVPGIGKTGAEELLAEHGTLAAMLEDTGAVGGRYGEALERHREKAELSRRLATIDTHVDVGVTLDDLQVPYPLPEKLNALYRELEFYSLLSAEELEKVHKHSSIQYFVCDTMEMAAAALQAECSGGAALHVLHEYPTPLKGDLVGIALSPREGFALYFPFDGPSQNLGMEGLELLRRWLEDPSIPKIMHEAKVGWVALQRRGVNVAGVVGDTALASFLVDPTLHIPHRIEQVAREYLHRGLQPVRSLVGGGRSLKKFRELTVDKAGAWACHLADAIGAAWPILEPMLKERGQWEHYVACDLPLSWVIGQMELDGIRVEPQRLAEMGDAFREMKQVEEDSIHEMAGHSFNVGSTKQLSVVLFEELGLPILKRTKTGYSTDNEVMTKLAPRHPIIARVNRWRTLAKLINTYTDVLQAAVDPRDGRIHGTFQQTVGVSGRLISTEPDLQRTPVKTEEFRKVRESFAAEPGNRLISADWSQIELRIMAHFSGDPLLMRAYTQGIDVHAQTASELFGVPVGLVSSQQREVGKTVNFATIYGQGPTALALQLDIERSEAKVYIDTFFRTYAGVNVWRERVVADAYDDGYVTTLLGRRRYVRELSSNNYTDRSYGERICMNTPIQGSGADICKLAMLTISRRLAEEGLSGRMVLQIHDELLFDVAEEDVPRVVAVVREVMEGCVALRVPLVVDIGVGMSWADAH